MSILENILEPKFVGNINRIKELNDLGLRSDAIAQRFNEHNIPITENMVKVVLNGELDVLRKKALPKQVVKDIKDSINNTFDTDEEWLIA